MPVYESEILTKEDLEKVCRRHRCAVCHGRLDVFFDQKTGKAFLACNDWPRTHHEGIERLAEPPPELNIPTRRKMMAEELGNETTTALDKYLGVRSLTQVQATEILKTVWPEAPDVEVVKAAIICHQYGLNPLMKHVFLIPFKKRNKKREVIGEEWVVVLGIGANRTIARRHHNYSYLDMTPRRMTEKEQQRINGEVDDSKIWAITKLKDVQTGAEALGAGSWPADEEPHGVEKGNTKLNMACIRSEREALDRLYPAEMPSGVEVMEEKYIDAEYRTISPKGDEKIGAKVVDEGGGEEKPAATSLSPPKEEKKTPQARSAPPAAEGKTPDDVTEDDLPDLNALCRVCFHYWKLQPNDVWKELGYKSMLEVSETPWECWLKITGVRQ